MFFSSFRYFLFLIHLCAEFKIDVCAATTADLIIATNENGGGGAYFLGRGKGKSDLLHSSLYKPLFDVVGRTFLDAMIFLEIH